MSHFDGFRDPGAARRISAEIARVARDLSKPRVRLMEVCGTHTMAIFRHGIHALLPPNVEMISGPGCPVCVTPAGYIDAAVALARRPKVSIATFGDMMKVPGSSSTLEKERGAGAEVRVVYSPLDALEFAKQNRGIHVVFLAVGFETTIPTVAATLTRARTEGVSNFSVLCAHKLIPPAMAALVADTELAIDGFMCPGHVSAIIGSRPYNFLAADHKRPCVIAGFEPVDILQAILMLLKQLVEGRAKVEIQYARCVTEEGNVAAQRRIEMVFEPCEAEWRGLGTLAGSGMRLRDSYGEYDAQRKFGLTIPRVPEPKGCLCAQVLRGARRPPECGLFGKRCTPATPVGPCMVSTEGTCAAYYKHLACFVGIAR